MSIWEVKVALETGDIDKGKSIINDLDVCNTEINSLKSFIYEYLEDYQTAEHYANNAISSANSPQTQFIANLARLNILYRNGEFDKMTALIEISSNLLLNDINTDITYWIAKYHNILGMFHHIQSELQAAFDHFQTSLKLYKDIDLEYTTADSLLNIGEVLIDEEKYEEAFEYLKKSNRLAKIQNNRLIEAYSNYNLGKSLFVQGEVTDALTFYKEALDLFEIISRSTGIIVTLNQIGSIEMYRGEINEAKNHFNKAYEISDTLTSTSYKGLILHNLGILAIKENDYASGIESFNQSIQIWTKIGNEVQVANALYSKGLALLDKNKDTSQIITKLEQIHSNTSLNHIEAKLKLLKAQALKSKSRLRDKASAQSILVDLIEMNIEDHRIKVEILVQLIGLKLFELKTFRDDTLIDELGELITQITELANEHNLRPLEIELEIIRTKLAMIQYELQDVGSHLDKADRIATRIQSKYYQTKIDNLRNEIHQELVRLQEMTEINSDIRDRIEQTKIEQYLDEVSRLIQK